MDLLFGVSRHRNKYSFLPGVVTRCVNAIEGRTQRKSL